MFKGVIEGLIAFCILIGVVVCGITWGAVELFSSDEIRVTTPLKPTKIELEIVNDTEIDTIYVYDLNNL